MIITLVLTVPVVGILIFGSLSIRLLSSRGLIVAAGVLCLIPFTPGWLLTLPIGIWTLLVLSRPDVKAAFPQKPVDLSRQGKWNEFCIASLLISLVGGLMSIREIDPGDDVRDRIIWAASVVLSIVFACIGLWQHSKYQGMKGKGFAIAALVIALAALIGFFVTLYYPVSW